MAVPNAGQGSFAARQRLLHVCPLDLQFVRLAEVVAPLQLPANRVGHLGMRVSQQQRGAAEMVVDVLVAIQVLLA